MSKKYHLSDNGPMICQAEKRECPVGGEHYSTLAEAEKAFGSNFKVQKGFKKVVTTGKISLMGGGQYYGIAVDKGSIEPFLTRWREAMKADAEAMEKKKAARDRGYHYHLTVVTPPENRKLPKENLESMPAVSTIDMLGVGKAVDGENEAWYVVCYSKEVEEWREKVGLPPKDLHITIGFKNKDVHTQKKDINTIVF